MGRSFALAGAVGVALAIAPASTDAKCRWSAAEVDRYMAKHASDSTVLTLRGEDATRFRLIMNGQDLTEGGKQIPKVRQQIKAVDIYWMHPLAFVVLRDGDCAPIVGTTRAHTVGYILHRVDPKRWDKPEHYQRDGA